ncbi:hypothetical protein Tco_1053668 [Tanacetum coccineum]|uniref:Uncharacterized protein n=1 Tax=Tanacetum coccineum TaxID=301880 RepID=A0ABQ5GUJ5_9ASTR
MNVQSKHGNVYRDNIFLSNAVTSPHAANFRPISRLSSPRFIRTHSVTKKILTTTSRANDVYHEKMQNNTSKTRVVTAFTASTSGSGTLPGKQLLNHREDLKGISLPEQRVAISWTPFLLLQ